MVLNIIGFTGNFGRPSKTFDFANHVAGEVARRVGAHTTIHDLSSLGPSFPVATRLTHLDEQAMNVVNQITSADLLIVGSPTYKGSYTGLFKHFFDMLDPASLAGKPVIALATGGGERHALMVEHQLRPLLGFFQAATLPTAVYACDRDFEDGVLKSSAIQQRVAQVADEAAIVLTRHKDRVSVAA